MATPSTAKKWDVAISFLLQDIGVAEALYAELSKGLQVFFSPRRQEEIAGTDGMEIFRQTFLADSRLNLVIYRERWGSTPWTTVESNAIRDSCVQNQFRNIFVFNIENTRVFPNWLPHNHMRFDLAEYTLEQVVGAIKLRVAEQGGQYEPMTPLKQAQAMKAEEEYEWERSGIRSIQSLPRIKQELETLFGKIVAYCAEIEKCGALDMEYEVNEKQSCILRCNNVGMIVRFDQRYVNTLDESGLAVEQYRGLLRFNRDSVSQVHYFPPKLIKKEEYEPDLSRSRQLGWKLTGKFTEFIPSGTLAQHCVMQFLDLVKRENAKN